MNHLRNTTLCTQILITQHNKREKFNAVSLTADISLLQLFLAT